MFSQKPSEIHSTTTPPTTIEDRPQTAFQHYKQAMTAFAVKRLLGPDVYELMNLKAEFVLGTLYHRAIDGDNFASVQVVPLWLSKMLEQKFGWNVPHQIYVVTGSDNLRYIGDFGEGKPSSDNSQELIERDPQARAAFDVFKNILPPNFLFLQQGPPVKHKKMIFKSHLHNSEGLVEISRDCFKRGIKFWNPNDSYQNQITSIVCNVIGKSIFGINNLPKKYIPKLRALGTALLETNQDDERIAACGKAILDMNREILEENEEKEDIIKSVRQQLEGTSPPTYLLDDLYEHIKDSAAPEVKKQMNDDPNFTAGYLELKRTELLNNPQLLQKTLIESRVFSLFVMEGNVSLTTMASIAYINENTAVKERLTAESQEYRSRNGLSDNDSIPHTALKELPYLKCVYLETLRLTSAAPGITRRTSVHSNLVLSDKNGNKKTHLIAPNSMLFAPTRSSHLDARLWSGRDFHLMSSNLSDDKVENNDLYLYSGVDDNNNEIICYATRTATGVIRDKIKQEEYKEHFADLLAALKKPRPENEPINTKAKTTLLDITFNRGQTRGNPLEFDPSRFEGDSEEVAARHKLLKPFSSGSRQCPAQSEYVPILVGTMIIESLLYDFQLKDKDSKLKKIPPVKPFTTEVSWPEELYAAVTPANAANTPQMKC